MESVASSSTSHLTSVSLPPREGTRSSLPKELLLPILSSLPFEERRLASLVSKDFREIAAIESPEWLNDLIQLKTDLLRILESREASPELEALSSLAEKLKALLSNKKLTETGREVSAFRELLLLDQTTFTQLTTLFGSNHKLLQKAQIFRSYLKKRSFVCGQQKELIRPLAEKGRLQFAKMFFDLVDPKDEWKLSLLSVFAHALIEQGDLETSSIITEIIYNLPVTQTQDMISGSLIAEIHSCFLKTCALARDNRELGRLVAQDFTHWHKIHPLKTIRVNHCTYKSTIIAPILETLVELELWEQVLDFVNKSEPNHKKFCFRKLFFLCLNSPKKETFLKSIEFATQLDRYEEKPKAFEAIIATSIATYNDYETAEQVMRLLTGSTEDLEKEMLVLRLAVNGETQEVERLWAQFLETYPIWNSSAKVNYRDYPIKSAAPFRIASKIFMKKGDKESARKFIKAFLAYAERSEWQVVLQDGISVEKAELLDAKKRITGFIYKSTILEPILKELVDLELLEQASDLAASRRGKITDFYYEKLFSLCLKSPKKEVFLKSIGFAKKLDCSRGKDQYALEAIILTSIETYNDYETAEQVVKVFTRNTEQLESCMHILRLAINGETQEVEKLWAQFLQTSPLKKDRYSRYSERSAAPFRLASRIFAKQGNKKSAWNLIDAFTNYEERGHWCEILNDASNPRYRPIL